MRQPARRPALLPLLACACLSLAGVARAEDPPRRVFVTVMDEAGVPIRGLGAADFAVREGGRDRQVLKVTPADERMDVALLLDTSNALDAGLPALKAAATAFIDTLPPEHRIGLYTFGDRASRIVDFTENRRELYEAVQRLYRTETLPRLIDAVELATRELRARDAARPVVVALTGTGADVSGRSAGSVIRLVADAGVALHLVAARATTAYGSARAPSAIPDRSRALSQLGSAGEGDRELTQLVQQGPEVTGGSLERVASFEGAAGAVARVISRLVTSYDLEYAGGGGNRPRNLQLGVMYEGVVVRATVAPRRR